MRLARVEAGASLSSRLLYAVIRLVSGSRAPDVVRVLRHRPGVFGAPFNQAVEAALRGPSEWTVGERELVAAFTSKLNHCRF